MANDAELLCRFAKENSEPAFREFVRVRIDFVYATALRLVNGDVHLAEEVTQNVFIDLARKAPRLAERSNVMGWLYTSTRFAAAKARRSRLRRFNTEQAAQVMHEILSPQSMADVSWDELRPVIDDALSELSEVDREAILLRYFESRTFAELGTAAGLAENSARMRVTRALEKLRAGLERRGITSTAAALGGALAAQPLVSAPVGLAASVASVSLVGSVAVAPLVGFMSISKVSLGLVAAAVLGTGAYLTGRYQGAAKMELREAELAALRSENQARVDTAREARRGGVTGVPRTMVTAGATEETPVDASVSGTAPVGPQAALRMLVDFKTRGVMNAGVTFVERDGKLSRAFAELFYLTSTEQEALQLAVDRTQAQLTELERANATVSRDAQGALVIDVKSFAKQGGAAYDAFMKSFAETLGPERNAAYLALGATQVERALGQFGASHRTVTFSINPAAAMDERKYLVSVKYVLPSEGGATSGGFKTMREAVEYAGTTGRLVPPDFGE